MKKLRQLVKETTAIDQQTEEIHQKFRMDKIKKRVWSAFRGGAF